MKLERKETWALLASLALLILGVSVFAIFGNQHRTSASKVSQNVQTTKLTTQKLEELLTKLEKEPTDEGISQADKLLKKLPTSDDKTKLTERLSNIKMKQADKKAEESAISAAEEAVQKLENEQNNDNLTSAQTAVDKIKTANKKDVLQARINVVKAVLEAQALTAQQEVANEDVPQYASEADTQGDTYSSSYDPYAYYQYSAPQTQSQPSQSQPSQTPAPSTPSNDTPTPAPSPSPDTNSGTNSGGNTGGTANSGNVSETPAQPEVPTE